MSTTNSSAGSGTGADTSAVKSFNCHLESKAVMKEVRTALEQVHSERRLIASALESLSETMSLVTENFGRDFQMQEPTDTQQKQNEHQKEMRRNTIEALKKQENKTYNIRNAQNNPETSVPSLREELTIMKQAQSNQEEQPVVSGNAAQPSRHLDPSATFTWRIQSATSKIKLGRLKEEVSSAFYSSHGYRLQARIKQWWRAGAAKHKISIRILPGEHDDQLPWPFLHEVTRTLMHPTDTTSNSAWTRRPRGGLSLWERPSATGEGNKWWWVGSYYIHSLEDFINTPDDVIFIQFQIDTPELLNLPYVTSRHVIVY